MKRTRRGRGEKDLPVSGMCLEQQLARSAIHRAPAAHCLQISPPVRLGIAIGLLFFSIMSFAQSVPDLISNRVQFMFMSSSVAAPLVNTGKVRALGIVGPNRLPILANVPTLAEQGMGRIDTSSWDGIVVKAGTPKSIVDRLNTEIVRILAKPEIKAKFVEMGMTAVSSTPEELGALIEAETTRWGALIKAANITSN